MGTLDGQSVDRNVFLAIQHHVNIIRYLNGNSVDANSAGRCQYLLPRVIVEGIFIVDNDVVIVCRVDHLLLDYDISRTVLRIQHTGRTVAADAQLHQRIGALSQRRSGKGEHHASGQRRRYCTPDKFALFHGTTSFFPSHFYGGGYILQYLDYPTLYRILEANLRESP